MCSRYEQGVGSSNSYYDSDSCNDLNKPCSYASLRNVGNTCFLNSILYTLRYTPGFLPNLHHLHSELQQVQRHLEQSKYKSSSLGRNIPSLVGASSRSSSSKDLSLTSIRLDDGGYVGVEKSDSHIIIEELHKLFQSMRVQENISNGRTSPIAPREFKEAFTKKYVSFCGNMQQDAHEFYINLLNAMRDCCQYLERRTREINERHCAAANRVGGGGNTSPFKEEKQTKTAWNVVSQLKNNLFNKNRDSTKMNGNNQSADDSVCNRTSATDKTRMRSTSENLVHDEFEVISVLRTKCLECECVTERREILSNLNIPCEEGDDANSYDVETIFRDCCLTTELLRDNNKYYCENCFRLCEARREVCYIHLPRVLVVQYGANKTNCYKPSPLKFTCFCETCNNATCASAKDEYQLFSVITHKGSAIAEGHFVSFVQDLTRSTDFFTCDKDEVDFLSSKSNVVSSNISNSTSSSTKRVTRSFFKKQQGNSVTSNGDSVSALAHTKTLSNSTCERSADCCVIAKKYDAFYDSDYWLECNDEALKYLSPKEFNDQLLRRRNNTPYLLFYVKKIRQ